MSLADIGAAAGVVLNGIPGGLLALSLGFAAFPTGLGFIVGAIACFVLQSGIPISIQAESIVLAGTMGRDVKERLSIVLYAGILMTIVGLTGAMSQIVDLAGERVINGMMAGVGIILARIAMKGFTTRKGVTVVSFITAILTYFLLGNNLVYTILLSVVISSIYANVRKEEIGTGISADVHKLKFHRPVFNLQVLRGSLALACLTVGGNIAFGNLTASLGSAEANVDHLTVYSGLADAVSAAFGGGPVEAIISATGAAPNPVNSGILMMLGLAAVFMLGLLPKIGKFVPNESIYGFLFVLGTVVTVPANGALAFAGATGSEVLFAGVPMAVTAVADPFFGLLSGILLQWVL